MKKKTLKLCAYLSFGFCALGGVTIIACQLMKHNDWLLWTGFGLYFIGKAFFTGPILMTVAEKFGKD